MDTVSRAARSRIMARVRSQRNKSTELKIIRILKREGLKGWRRNSLLYGKPDFIYPKQRIALFSMAVSGMVALNVAACQAHIASIG